VCKNLKIDLSIYLLISSLFSKQKLYLLTLLSSIGSVSSMHAPKSTADVVGAMNLDQAHDILAAMKHIIEEDGGARAKMILEAHPQLVPALVQMQCRLGMSVPPELLPLHNSNNPNVPSFGGSSDENQQQQHLLQQVMHLTEEELNLLPAEDRDQMLLLRSQLAMGGAR
jgi:hypothetical protein